MNLSLLSLALFHIGLSRAVVQFSKSSLYDIYDFVGVETVVLTVCDNGCYIYASTVSSGVNAAYPPDDTYADNLIIYQYGDASGKSITSLSRQYTTGGEKAPQILESVTVINRNEQHDRFLPIALYVVDRIVAENTGKQVYDAASMKRSNLVPQSVTTIMSAVAFTVTVKGEFREINSVTVRLVGYDNANDDRGDGCPIAFQTPPESTLYHGYNFYANVPIVSLIFSASQRMNVQIGANTQFYTSVEYDNDGFISSPGWNGCKNPNSGEYQSFRSPAYTSINHYSIVSVFDEFSLSLEAEIHNDVNHTVVVRDLTNGNYVNWYGSDEDGAAFKQWTVDKTSSIYIKSSHMEGDQGFLIHHSGKQFVESSVSTPAPTQATLKDGSYCPCEVDNTGSPVGWKSAEIWVDLVIVLDTSEALTSESLQDAAAFIESLVRNDLLTLDHSAPFYTRVGVIAMSDAPEILYNLNMTKTDTVRDKVSITEGLSKVNLAKATQAAQNMFKEGQVREPNRGKLSAYNWFENIILSGGAIIVTNLLKEGQTPKPELEIIALNGLFFTDFTNLMGHVQALCKSNCWCGSDPMLRVPFSGTVPEPGLQLVIPTGGCYARPAWDVPQTSFSQAMNYCASSGVSFIATAHNANKTTFLNMMVNENERPEGFFWIGYTKGDDGSWQWVDGSIGPYTNWGADEPSAAQVSKCAYVDQSSEMLEWGAGNCQMSLQYVCEHVPCAAGNNNC